MTPLIQAHLFNFSEAHTNTFLSQRNIFHAFEDPLFIGDQVDYLV